MKVLVTGGSGFIGTNLVRLLAETADLVNLDPEEPRNPEQAGSWRRASVLDLEGLKAEVARFRPQVVVHLGARTDLKGASVDDYGANTTGVRNVIDAVRSIGDPVHTVFASSRLVFAIDHEPTHLFDYRPSTFYGQSKIEGERIVRASASNAGTWTIVRPTSIWGPWFDTPYRDFFDTVATGRYVKFRGRDPLKSFGFVGNAVHEITQIIAAGPEKTNERVYWLSDYEPIRLSEWADMISDRLGRSKPRYAPWWLARMAAAGGDAMTHAGFTKVPLTSFRLNNLVTPMVYDTSATNALCGPLPYDLRAGVDMTVEWYLKHRHQRRS